MIYLDTGCLLKLYYPEPDSASVAAAVFGKVIIFSSLHELELTNALSLKVFQGRATPEQAGAVKLVGNCFSVEKMTIQPPGDLII